MDLMVHSGMFKVSDIFYNPTLICTSPKLFGELLGLHGATCLVLPLA
jgi:hypothetical protein